MCARAAYVVWLCHPGGLLSPRDLVKVNVDAATGVKKARLTAPTHRLEFMAPSEKLDKLLAIAHLRAEMAKADMEARAVDLDAAEELFNKNPLTWSCRPKEVFVLRCYKTPEGGWVPHVAEIVLKLVAGPTRL